MTKTRTTLPALALGLTTAITPARAQPGFDCLTQRFHPDFQPRSLEFGVDVAISAEHMIVVDRFGGGDIYTYRKDAGGQWALNQKVPGGNGGDVMLDGDRFITADLSVDPRGGARLYEFDGARWNEVAVLAVPPDAEPGSGEHVALAGPHVAVGNGGEDVHIFFEDGGVWSYVETIVSPDSPAVRSDFGEALEADREWLLVGAWLESVRGPQHGAVYAYRWTSAGHVELQQKIVPLTFETTTRLGSAISVAGTTLAIGATHDDALAMNAGAVFVYELSMGSWEFQQKIESPTPEVGGAFGWEVDTDGSALAIGARREFTGGDGVGTAHVYRRGQRGVWLNQARVTLHGIGGFDYAESLAVADGQLVVGGSEAPHMGYDQGVADVYDLSCLVCPPDLDLDGTLTVFDFLTFLNLFQDADPLADFDGDGEFTIFDFLAFQAAFDAGCD